MLSSALFHPERSPIATLFHITHKNTKKNWQKKFFLPKMLTLGRAHLHTLPTPRGVLAKRGGRGFSNPRPPAKLI